MILNQTGGTQFSAHCLRGAVIGRLEERWVQQGKPRLACRSFYLNQEKKSVLSTKPWSFWAEVLLDSPDHVQAPSCWQNQLTMALNWTYRAFFRELAHARGATSEVSVLLRFIVRERLLHSSAKLCLLCSECYFSWSEKIVVSSGQGLCQFRTNELFL